MKLNMQNLRAFEKLLTIYVCNIYIYNVSLKSVSIFNYNDKDDDDDANDDDRGSLIMHCRRLLQ